MKSKGILKKLREAQQEHAIRGKPGEVAITVRNVVIEKLIHTFEFKSLIEDSFCQT